jgi:hypothetical protein
VVTDKPKVTEQQMMERPSLWPQWPWLPLKRNSGRDLGCLYASSQGGNPVTFVGVNLFDMAKLKDKPIPEWPGFRLVTPAELIKEGWIVD